MTALRVSTTTHDQVAVIRVDDPSTSNALSHRARVQATAALESVAADRDIRAVVLTGGDDTFLSGGDIGELAADPTTAMAARDGDRFWQALDDVPVPVVAAVAGPVLGGGCEVALACDLVVAADGAVFGLPEVGLGILPGAGGVQRWGRVAGRLRAAAVALAGQTVDAWTAWDLGLVSRVVPQQRTVAAGVALAAEVAARPPLAVRSVLASLADVEEVPLSVATARDRDRVTALLGTADAREGFAAFLEQRPPRFIGR
ncbi:enoyl-CoA hydratase-related protein [Euzebya sp.]|uniref:enoyl-CoA hydratase-related protein n=1 Tax=Euzebya sp. TaxID=1971409 RepID=UPI003519806D